ncbi:hypothetical protein JCM11641_002789 [Rhodosporidiobolus odoratus]
MSCLPLPHFYTVFTTPRYINKLGARIAWDWFPSCFVTFLWIIFFLPETEGRTLEELDELFANRVPAWKFKSYVCTGALGNGPSHRITKNEDEKELDKAEESREEDIGRSERDEGLA